MPDCAAIYEQFYTRTSFRKRRDYRAQVRTGKILVGRSFSYGVNAATSERLQFTPRFRWNRDRRAAEVQASHFAQTLASVAVIFSQNRREYEQQRE